MYYRNAAAAIVVYDITSEATFDVLQEWITELHRLGPQNIVLAIAANKCDLEEKREVCKSRQITLEIIVLILQQTVTVWLRIMSLVFEKCLAHTYDLPFMLICLPKPTSCVISLACQVTIQLCTYGCVIIRAM